MKKEVDWKAFYVYFLDGKFNILTKIISIILLIMNISYN